MVMGTTSACAENTVVWLYGFEFAWNYLRVRGEYAGPIDVANHEPELPPRARRIPGQYTSSGHPVGTTSACAENTLNELGLL